MDVMIERDFTAFEFNMSFGGILIIPPPNEVGGGVYWIHLVRPSVRLSVDDMVSGA